MPCASLSPPARCSWWVWVQRRLFRSPRICPIAGVRRKVVSFRNIEPKLHCGKVALQVLSSCVLSLAPPAVDLLEALGRCVCTRRACCFSLRICRTSAASVELLPRGWRAVAFPRWLHDHSCSTWLIVILIVRCCFGGSCVRDGLAACLRTSLVALLLLPTFR